MHLHASFRFFSKQNLETFNKLHAFLPLNVAKLSTIKTVRFLAHYNSNNGK